MQDDNGHKLTRVSCIAAAAFLFATAIGGLLFILADRSNESADEVATVEAQESDVEFTSRQPRREADPEDTTLNQQPDCTPWSAISQSPDAFLVDEWYSSWGAPASFTKELMSRPYAHYSTSDLESLAESGDWVAMHELGQSLIWSAFRNDERLPDFVTLWDIGGQTYPYADNIGTDQLARDRDLLYRAAVRGRLYALVDISLSFAHQNVLEQELGTLNNNELLELQIEAYAHGEAVERLIAGMPSNFFQAMAPDGRLDDAEKRLSEVVDRFVADRLIQGQDGTTLPTVDDGLLTSFRFCIM